MTALGVLLMDKSGRRPLLMVGREKKLVKDYDVVLNEKPMLMSANVVGFFCWNMLRLLACSAIIHLPGFFFKEIIPFKFFNHNY